MEVIAGLWVGNSKDGETANISAVLNVAVDLCTMRNEPTDEYAQVGLIDGPGNELGDYCAAALCLKAMVRRHEKVLVYDHDGGRALVVCLMLLNLVKGQRRPDPAGWSHWPTWVERFEDVRGKNPPKVHPYHVKSFDLIPWGVLSVL